MFMLPPSDHGNSYNIGVFYIQALVNTPTSVHEILYAARTSTQSGVHRTTKVVLFTCDRAAKGTALKIDSTKQRDNRNLHRRDVSIFGKGMTSQSL